VDTVLGVIGRITHGLTCYIVAFIIHVPLIHPAITHDLVDGCLIVGVGTFCGCLR